MSDQNEHPEIAEHEWYDDAFRVEETRWKTWRSFAKDGKNSSPHYSETLVLQQPDFTLKDAKKAGLLPQHMKEQ